MSPIPQDITSESQLGAENVYVLSKEQPPLVQGVDRKFPGFCGECVRGPVDTVVEITSPSRFKAIFGGRDYQGGSGDTVYGKIWQQLIDRRFGRFYVVRAAAAAAATAEKDFVATATPIVNIAASSPGAWAAANLLTVTIADASDGDATHWDLIVNYVDGYSKRYRNLDTTAGNDNTLAVLGDDLANLVVITKLADGRPDNAVDSDLDDTAGSDGSIADTDLTGSGKGIELLVAKKEVGYIAVCGRSNSTVKTKLDTEAASLGTGKMIFVVPDANSTSLATFATEVGSLTATKRLVCCFNHYKVTDPVTGTKVWQEPHMLMISCLSQTDADRHPGSHRNVSLSGGIRELYNDLGEGDLDTARSSRICAIEFVRTATGASGYVFRSGVTTLDNATAGEIATVRQRDFLVELVLPRIAFDIKEPNSLAVRESRANHILAALRNLARQGRYIDLDDGQPACLYDTEQFTTSAERSAGLQRDRMSVKLIAHALWLVLDPVIDTVNSDFFVEDV